MEDGNTYPLVKLEISSGSHPFFTGKQKLLDSAGRVEKFNKKYSKKTLIFCPTDIIHKFRPDLAGFFILVNFK